MGMAAAVRAAARAVEEMVAARVAVAKVAAVRVAVAPVAAARVVAVTKSLRRQDRRD